MTDTAALASQRRQGRGPTPQQAPQQAPRPTARKPPTTTRTDPHMTARPHPLGGTVTARRAPAAIALLAAAATLTGCSPEAAQSAVGVTPANPSHMVGTPVDICQKYPDTVGLSVTCDNGPVMQTEYTWVPGAGPTAQEAPRPDRIATLCTPSEWRGAKAMLRDGVDEDTARANHLERELERIAKTPRCVNR